MSKKLLLADDSITIQKVIGITFANEDYELSVVDNGDAALEKARSMNPDLILADVFMPGKNGYELCAAVRQDPALRNIPVLLLTGTFEPFDENKARSVGADSWIAKPFESQALIDRVEELLARLPEPAAAVATAPAAAAAEPLAPLPAAAAPVPDADIWGDLADAGDAGFEALPTAEFAFADTLPDVAETATAEEALQPDEDIWGDVSFDEEDLLAGEPAGKVTDDVWGTMAEDEASVEAPSPVFAEETFEFADEADSLTVKQPLPVAAPTPAIDEFIFEEEAAEEFVAPMQFNDQEPEEEEILPLEEIDILAEEDLDETSLTPAEETFLFAEEEAPLGTELSSQPAVFGEVPTFAVEAAPAEQEVGGEEDFALSEEGPEWGIAEEPAIGLEPSTAAAEEFLFTPAEAAQLPEAEVAPLAAAVVEERTRALSEEELAQIVERVAGSLIERLAGSVLEKIAWEVVPDLAESLVREEIRKIRQEA